ncbi:MAG: primosomal protein N' [Cytophagales bacterium]|jgi:primosomal protein N' (replication factor Y)|nr:primosomal protein N' [Cytophagales bacterium]MCA6386805.1 primosomal protein N' [Cytophagales bacterium]MCA6391672.1 primosomal protein N' [Cytophagales bacterium]MCA6393778.1 primosomal protein N' [Cytophagales bacterium]MCA6399279.1 primosomal protein N' [Cytophagales bacterium]
MTSGELAFEEPSTLFADLIIPVPIPRLFTYRVPKLLNEKIKTGQRVIVPFGKKKIVTGIIFSVHENPPKDYEAKSILELLDESEVIYPQQFKLYQWIADYYLCTLGEVMIAALPSGLKLSGESKVQINPNFDPDHTSFEFSEKEWVLLHQLQKTSMTYTEVTKLMNSKNIYTLLRSLVSKSAIILYEEIREKYKPKTEKHVRLTTEYVKKKSLESLFESLSSKPKQEEVILLYLQQVPAFSHPELNQRGMAKSELLKKEISPAAFASLVKAKILEEFEIAVPRFGFEDPEQVSPLLLSEKQQVARNEVLSGLNEKGTVLLHGVTGSGKTEIYIDLIKRALDGGNQILYLLPEIALTTQIVFRLKKIFGSAMGVYHSKFSDNERVEVWNGILSGRFKLVIGVRSSIFLPFDNLGLIIVDEEHDSSYKQHEPAPRYHARDVSMVMAQIHHAKVIVGSATPSVESFYHAQAGRYHLVTLTDRFGEAQLPDIVFANLVKEKKRKTMKGEFTSLLVNEIKESLSKKEQVILFQNRRGYSPMVECEDCGWIPKCINCSVSLTYHQYRNAMICHYCGYKEDMPSQCPTCSSKRIKSLGYGTEKLEEELKLYFPDARIQRMDSDTTRSKSGYETIINSFEKGETDILVGTQMVTKGLDFDRVNLVGVFDADRMMHFPDFRSYEKAFQLITQVSGRSGRREKKGKVVIQTSNPEHPLFTFVINHNVSGFIQEQLNDRQEFFYPPFSRLINVTIKHTNKTVANDIANRLSDQLAKNEKGIKIVGPGEPMISKIRNEFLMSILIKIGRDQGRLGEIKRQLYDIVETLMETKEFRNTKIVFDVDPA